MVPNIPPTSNMIALKRKGYHYLKFSEPIRNIFIAYVSLNGNGYAFGQDFDILSYGHPDDGNCCGYFGCGISSKVIGKGEYRLVGSGEPHGTIAIQDTFSLFSWRSMSDENWNGFTI
eukprot:7079746-Ditylum_brightwellii.AAC.1